MKKIIYLLLIFLVVFMTMSNVYAIDIAKVGETVIQEGEYDSIRFVAGNSVTNKATVKGLSLIAGNQLTLHGSSEYGFYAGNVVNINENIQKDLFAAGNSVIIGSSAEIGRDVFIAGNIVVIGSNLKRDLRVGASKVDISGITIMGDAYIDCDRLIMNEDTVITGKLTYYESTVVSGIENAKIGSKNVKEVSEVVVEYTVLDKIQELVFSYFSSVVVMIIVLLILPRAKERLNNTKIEVGYIAIMSAIGFGLLVFIPIVSLIALFTGILTPLALIIIALYIIIVYLSSLVTAYVFGNLICTKLIKVDSMFASVLIGILLLKLVTLIPVIGGFIVFLSIVYGIGLIGKFIVSRD